MKKLFERKVTGKEDEKNKSKLQLKKKEEWERYNYTYYSSNAVKSRENGIIYCPKSYTHMFFNQFTLKSYLNDESKKILQFGASHGSFLDEYKDTWDTMGYDFSEQAIQALAKKNIPCRQLDLNDAALTQLYLKQDIRDSSVNFVAIRVFQYLDEQALIALMYTLLNNAAVNSRYIIANSIGPERDHQTLVKNYVSSFFGARTDMKFLLATQTPKKLDDNPDSLHDDDEVMVIQKL